MSTFYEGSYSDTCVALNKAIQDLRLRIQVSDKNRELYEKYKENNEKLERSVTTCRVVIDTICPMISDVQKYIADKRKTSMQNINNAIRMASEIIPSSTEGIYFQLDGEEAWLSTPDGLEVDNVEGGGFRQISSTFIRSVILEAIPETLQTMFLDELFSLVSPANSTTLSLYLNVICQNMQVISIEQKPQVYSNIDHRMFIFSKHGNYVSVEMQDIKRNAGGNNDLQIG